MLIDTHCHVDDARFDGERAQVLARARQGGVAKMINIGCDIAGGKRARALAQTHDDIFFACGIHPHEAKLADHNFIKELEILAQHPKNVAIGECGLDFYYDHSPRDVQRAVFISQIELARKINKALVIHVRDAWDECIEILKDQHLTSPIVIHCFTGTIAHAQKFLALGAMLSISGVATFKSAGDLHEIVTSMPLDRMLIETDSPYLAPEPHRGKRNEPAYVTHVSDRIATLRHIDPQTVQHHTSQNAIRTFNFAMS